MDTVETTPDEAREVLAQEQQERVQECRHYIDLILERYNCQLEAGMLLRAGQVIPRVNIVAND